MRRVFVTGGSGVVGRALVERLLAGGDEVVALARSSESKATLSALGARVAYGDLLDEDALSGAMAGCAVAFNVAGVNALCVADTGPMIRANVHGPAVAIRAAARTGVPRVVHTSSAATIGEPQGVVGREETSHRGWYLSDYERSKTEGERVAFETGRDAGVEVVCVNPSSVQGPGRSGGTARFLLAFLDGRLRLFVPTNVSLVDIADCAEGHVLAAEHGAPGERYVLNGVTLTISEALALAGEVAGVTRKPRLVPRPVALAGGYAVENAFRLARRRPPVCREMVKTLLHGHRYDGSRATRELGLRYTNPRETLLRTVEWARGAGLVRPR
ncbi:MAG: NAD-dependent epimerase/dehydratase family protein [Solirubrobacterales bacterium]|nr:NAD-dependent epimerase/dehydratase family protein [Solirubrobacterales bacterium]